MILTQRFILRLLPRIMLLALVYNECLKWFRDCIARAGGVINANPVTHSLQTSARANSMRYGKDLIKHQKQPDELLLVNIL